MIFFVSCFAIGCNRVNNKSSETSTQTNSKAQTNTPLSVSKSQLSENNRWRDSAIMNYINNSDNEMIKLAKEQKIKDEWTFDDSVISDTAKYSVYEIGHDVSDKDGGNTRFVSDAWIYINYDSKKFYVYNGPEAKLYEWKH